MNLLKTYLPKEDFSGQEDFEQHYRIHVPESFNFAYDVADKMAEIAPEQTAILWLNPEGLKKVYTFSDLKIMSDKAANLFSGLGIRKGDRVMLILKRHIQFWFAMLGLHKIGAVTIPATHLLTEKDIMYRIDAAGIKTIVCTGDGDIARHVADAAKGCPVLEHCLITGEATPQGFINFDSMLEATSPDWTPLPRWENSHPFLLYFTSGTTGHPKMVCHDMTYPLGHITTARYWQNCTDGGLHWTISDTGWGKAVWGKFFGQMICGSTILVYDFDKFVPSDILRIMTETGVTSFCAPPTMYRFMLPEDLKSYDFSRLQYCSVAGEPLNPEVFAQWSAATGCEPREGFGQTETVCVLMNHCYIRPRAGSMGRPNPVWKVDIIDSEGTHCEVGQVGEIVVRTDDGAPAGLFLGYYNDPERTKTIWDNDVFHTGDTAWMDEDGFFWYVGRTDDIIKSSGYRIGPFEVESALMEHPAVLETAVTGAPDPVRGQVVKANIILRKGWDPSPALVKELQDHVKRTTAPYKYPRIIEFVESLPKTISGKIRRKELRGEQDD